MDVRIHSTFPVRLPVFLLHRDSLNGTFERSLNDIKQLDYDYFGFYHLGGFVEKTAALSRQTSILVCICARVCVFILFFENTLLYGLGASRAQSALRTDGRFAFHRVYDLRSRFIDGSRPDTTSVRTPLLDDDDKSSLRRARRNVNVVSARRSRLNVSFSRTDKFAVKQYYGESAL